MSRARPHSTRARAALQNLTEVDPALAALSLWCAHRDTDDTGTAPARTVGATICYGPEFADLPLPVATGVCAHHVLHVALRHAARSHAMALRSGDAFAADVFNAAADGLINEVLDVAGHALPRPALTARDLLAAAGEDVPDPLALLEGHDAERLYLTLMAARNGQGGAGSGEGRLARIRQAIRKRGHAPDLTPEPEDAAAPDPDGRGQDALEWQGHLARALEAGRQAGRGIGVFGHRLADLPRTRTPWERVLRGLVLTALTDAPAHTRTRPSRAWIARDAAARAAGRATPGFEPGAARRRDAPRVAVCLDSSGSVNNRLLARFGGEIASLAARTGAEIDVIAFDIEVRAHLRPLPGRTAMAAALAALPLSREAGTDFQPALADAAARNPALIIMLTDLDGPVGAAPGRIPVIWAVPAPPERAPAFGRVIYLRA